MVHEGKLEIAGRRRARAQVRTVPPGVHRRLPQDADAFARAGQRTELPRAGSRLGAGRRLHRGAEGKICRAAGRRISRGSAPQYPRQSRSLQGTRRRRGAAAAARRAKARRSRRPPTAIRFASTASTCCWRTTKKTPRRSSSRPRRRYPNLFGTIQRSYDSRGVWTSDFMDLRAGSMLRADGGFLIMYALDALTETGVWRTLKRTLNHAKLEIQPMEMFFPFGTSALKPEPIDLTVKIILIGDRNMYETALQLRGGVQENFQGARRVRRRNGDERRRHPPVQRPAAQALRGRRALPVRPHRRGRA